MKAEGIKVGGLYLVSSGGRMITVRVDKIHPDKGKFIKNKGESRYDCTILHSGMKVEYRSAAKFRSEVPSVTSTVETITPTKAAALLARPGEGVEEAMERVEKEVVDAIKSVEPVDLYPEDEHRADDSYTQIREGEQSPSPTTAESTPAQSADTTGATAPALTSDRTEEGEQSVPPTESGAAATIRPAPTASAPASTPLSSLIASSNRGRQRGEPVAGMVPNEEQEAIIEMATKLFGEVRLMVVDGQLVLVVMAGAGSGKTATCKMLEIVLSGRIQYTAFNRPLVDEARPKFKRAKCSTTHQLAFHAEGKRFAHRLPGKGGAGRMRSEQVARYLGIEALTVVLKGQGAPDEAGNPTDRQKVLQAAFLAGQVMVATQRFTQSADHEISAKHLKYIDGIDEPGKRDNNEKVKDYLLPFCRKAWSDLSKVDGQLPFSHDCYVKIWQLGTGDDRPIIASDVILLDEYQDTAPVFLDVLAQQRHALLVMVGDDNQRIYEWRGAVNAGDHFPDAPRCMLSQSYRFGQAIADVANTILAELQEPTELRMRGNPSVPSRVGPVAEPKCFLYRTNAGAIGRVMQAVAEGKRPFLLGNVVEAIEFCKAALDLQAKRPTSHTDLGCFSDWAEVEEYAGTDEGADLKLMVKLVNTFGAAEIIAALKDMPKEEDADLTVSTAHKSKGREWDTVRLGTDFPTCNKMTDPDVRLLYVAATRAKLTLDVSECPPFCGGSDQGVKGEGGESRWIPGLSIRYTKPMPTQEEQDDWIRSQAQGQPKALTAPQVKAMFEAIDNVQAAKEIAEAKREQAKPPVMSGTFTWTRFSDKWCIRGPVGTQVGVRVRVVRKDGSSQEVTIKEVVKRFPDAWIYS